jgi:hypothetical protein
MDPIETDYLIIGSGAMGMAFADTLLAETNATMVIVDRHHQPGGHWNDAYPYVRLHQPSAFYGVNSKQLGSNTIDAGGWNKGLYELATNSEVVAYFDQVMHQSLLPSGRVRYFPSCNYHSDDSDNPRFQSLLSHEVFEVKATKVVDATYMNVTVPSIRPPSYAVDQDVACKPPNALPKVTSEFEHYVVVGAGKTGMDACLFLLKNDVSPEKIAWVTPRDSWILDRKNIQPGKLFAGSIARLFTDQAKDFAQASDIADLFARVEARGGLLRIDPTVTPTMYRCATVTTAELEQLRRITNIIRLGRVKNIEPTTITLDDGELPVKPNTLFVDCSADGLERRPELPVFDGNKITLQTVRTCQQVFSAAFIAHLEAEYSNDAEKNDLCTPVPHPDSDLDFLRSNLGNMQNTARWSADISLQAWLKQARLDGFSDADAANPDMTNPEVLAQMEQLGEIGKQAAANLEKLLGSES